VREHGQQPALGVWLPPVNDREQRDRALDRRRLVAARRLQSLELASFGAVDDVPPTGPQLFTEGVGGGKVALPPAQNALGEQSLGVVAV
jgi:hypothetical protein